VVKTQVINTAGAAAMSTRCIMVVEGWGEEAVAAGSGGGVVVGVSREASKVCDEHESRLVMRRMRRRRRRRRRGGVCSSLRCFACACIMIILIPCSLLPPLILLRGESDSAQHAWLWTTASRHPQPATFSSCAFHEY